MMRSLKETLEQELTDELQSYDDIIRAVDKAHDAVLDAIGEILYEDIHRFMVVARVTLDDGVKFSVDRLPGLAPFNIEVNEHGRVSISAYLPLPNWWRPDTSDHDDLLKLLAKLHHAYQKRAQP